VARDYKYWGGGCLTKPPRHLDFMIKERQLNTLFGKYLKLHPREDTEVYELKRVIANCFNPNVVKQCQIDSLLASLDGLYHKIADQPSICQLPKPFDCLWIKATRAFLVPIFYKPRRYKKAFLIPVKEFLKFTKSIKMTELEEMGFESFYL